MAYDPKLADRVREHLAALPNLAIEEKEMFGVLNFLVQGKTCVCVREYSLMLRFDPERQEEVAESNGYHTMLMKGKEYKGYGYIDASGLQDPRDFAYFLTLCLKYNKIAKASTKSKGKPNNGGKKARG